MLKNDREQNTAPEKLQRTLDKSPSQTLILAHFEDGSVLFKRLNVSILDGIYSLAPVEHGADLTASRIKVALAVGSHGSSQAFEGQWLGDAANAHLSGTMSHGSGHIELGRGAEKVAVALPQGANPASTTNTPPLPGGAATMSPQPAPTPSPQQALQEMG